MTISTLCNATASELGSRETSLASSSNLSSEPLMKSFRCSNLTQTIARRTSFMDAGGGDIRDNYLVTMQKDRRTEKVWE